MVDMSRTKISSDSYPPFVSVHAMAGYAGRDFRLTDVFGTVVKDILI